MPDNFELLRAFCLGVSISEYSRENYPGQDIAIVTKLLKEIASGEFTIQNPPDYKEDSKDARHLINVIVRNQRELATKIVDQLGPEISE